MKKIKLALLTAGCLIVLGLLGIGYLGWQAIQRAPQKTTVASQSSRSTEKRSLRPTEPNLQAVTKEVIPRLVESEADVTLEGVQNSQETNQVPDVTDGQVLRQSTFDFPAILKGNYRSVAGTWQDGYGNILFIDQKGQLTPTTRFEMTAVKNGILGGDYRDDEIGYGAGAQFIPAGIDASVFVADTYPIYDASDVGKDRIWLGDSWASLADPSIFYYRLKEPTTKTE